MSLRKFVKLLTGPIVIATFGALLFLERRRPLRKDVESKLNRNARNMIIAALAGATLQLLEKPVIDPLTKIVERKNIGLTKALNLPRPIETLLAVILMDYTLYLWHVLTHRVPLLWRFHLSHHADLDLDASTALRFHFGELTISIAWRAGQVLLIGVSPLSLSIWQLLLIVSILFHHSNVRLPRRLESALSHLIVTPRLHGIHHSVIENERESNWSSGLTLWDRLHGTLKRELDKDDVTVGVPEYKEIQTVTLSKVLIMPFKQSSALMKLEKSF